MLLSHFPGNRQNQAYLLATLAPDDMRKRVARLADICDLKEPSDLAGWYDGSQFHSGDPGSGLEPR